MNLKDRADSRVIDGVTYRCWPVLFGTLRPLLVLAVKAIGPAFAEAIKDGGSAAQMAMAIGSVCNSLRDEDVAKMAQVFGDASEYEEDGKSIPLVLRNQDAHFAGRPDVFLEWIQFAMEVNGFARFFSSLTKEAISATPPPSTPTSA